MKPKFEEIVKKQLEKKLKPSYDLPVETQAALQEASEIANQKILENRAIYRQSEAHASEHVLLEDGPILKKTKFPKYE